MENKRALSRLFPGLEFKTFAFPISEPRPTTKYHLGKRFCCCRGGGQALNAGMADLNLLKAYFLDKRKTTDINSVKRVIDGNCSRRGWLIFATHDVDDNPTRYGCSRELFEEVVAYAAASGAVILPVAQAFEQIQANNSK